MDNIPKIIHYCWFGGNPHPQLVEDCIASWKKYCPHYEIIEWNEMNFDIHSNLYVEEAYHAKKWAFVSDYVRLYAMYHYGGIYLDSDVELLQPIDRFLTEEAFTGFEANDSPVTAIMGAVKEQEFIGQLLHYYDNRHFAIDGKYDLTTNTTIITNIFKEHHICLNGKKQTICGCTVYPEITFCPNNIRRIFYRYSNKSFCVHHFMGSWGGKAHTARRALHQRLRMYIVHAGRNLVGTENIGKIASKIKKR